MRPRTHTADWLDQSNDAIDLRKNLPDERIDTIRRRADWLDDPERALVLAMFRDGKPATEIAALAGIAPRQARRRIRRAVTRLFDPRFTYVVAHAASWSPTRRRVARALFQHGRSIRATARALELTIHEVRRHRDAICTRLDAHTDTPDRAWRS